MLFLLKNTKVFIETSQKTEILFFFSLGATSKSSNFGFCLKTIHAIFRKKVIFFSLKRRSSFNKFLRNVYLVLLNIVLFQKQRFLLKKNHAISRKKCVFLRKRVVYFNKTKIYRYLYPLVIILSQLTHTLISLN